ncbi:MAG: TonB-dependent receptor [Spirochaetales bacterium]|nr:TonB-dependent receptor [Spirochaetales bacterium]
MFFGKDASTRKSRAILSVFLSFIITPLIAEPSLSFSLSPNKAGQLEPKLKANWDWSPSFSSRLSFASSNATDFTEDLEGFSAAITAMSQTLSGRIDPLVFNYRTGPFAFGTGIGAALQKLRIRETGYFDFVDPDGGDPETTDLSGRVFFNNIQDILILSPGILLEAKANTGGKYYLSLGGGYSPWTYIGLEHDFSSACVETPAWNTPKTVKSVTGSSTGGWEASLKAGAAAGILELDIEGKIESAEYAYDLLDFGGSLIERNYAEIKTSAFIHVSSPKVKIGGLRPQIGMGILGTRTENLISGDDPETETEIRYTLGFATR